MPVGGRHVSIAPHRMITNRAAMLQVGIYLPLGAYIS